MHGIRKAVDLICLRARRCYPADKRDSIQLGVPACILPKSTGENMMAEQINAFEMAQQQFDHVAKLLNLDPQISEVLRWPMREYSFHIPVRMDNGALRVFQGYRVQHNDARGPNK